jgi:hypothetical protein
MAQLKQTKRQNGNSAGDDDASLVAWFQTNITNSELIEWYKTTIRNNAEQWKDQFESVIEKLEQGEKPNP